MISTIFSSVSKMMFRKGTKSARESKLKITKKRLLIITSSVALL